MTIYRFAIPFTFATTLGLAAVALRGTPGMQVLTPGKPMLLLCAIIILYALDSIADVSAGLPAAAAASALLGKSGAAALLILLFLAVTSATSAELIAVSSILTYDVYKRYINPNATEAQILRMGHMMVAFFALVMGIAGLIFFYIGVSMVTFAHTIALTLCSICFFIYLGMALYLHGRDSRVGCRADCVMYHLE